MRLHFAHQSIKMKLDESRGLLLQTKLITKQIICSATNRKSRAAGKHYDRGLSL